MNKLIRNLDKYWDVQRVPKHDLHREEEHFVDLKKANLFYICMVIFLFTVTVIFACAGAFL